MKTNSWTTAGQAKDISSSPNPLVRVLRRGRHWVWGRHWEEAVIVLDSWQFVRKQSLVYIFIKSKNVHNKLHLIRTNFLECIKSQISLNKICEGSPWKQRMHKRMESRFSVSLRLFIWQQCSMLGGIRPLAQASAELYFPSYQNGDLNEDKKKKKNCIMMKYGEFFTNLTPAANLDLNSQKHVWSQCNMNAKVVYLNTLKRTYYTQRASSHMF